MNGQGTIFNDKEILFWVIIIPKKFRITKPMEEVNGIFYIGLDGIIYKKISNEPKKKHSFL